MNNFKKLLSPIVYAIFLPLALFCTLFLSTWQIRVPVRDGVSSIPLLPFGFLLNFLLLFIIVLPVIFWLANLTMYKIERLENPKISDHFRQSSLYYLLMLVLIFVLWPSVAGVDDNKPRILVFAVGLIGVGGIGFNALYLSFRSVLTQGLDSTAGKLRATLKKYWLAPVLLLILIAGLGFYFNNSLESRTEESEQLWEGLLNKSDATRGGIYFIVEVGTNHNMTAAYEMLSAEAKRKIDFQTFTNATSVSEVATIFDSSGLSNVYTPDDLCGDYSIPNDRNLYKFKTVKEDGQWKVLGLKRCD